VINGKRVRVRQVAHWTGESGTSHQYEIFPIGSIIGSRPGIYIFAAESSTGQWLPSYIGQTSDLDQGVANHEKHVCVFAHGSTHVHIRLTAGDEEARRREAKDLIARWNPPCNARSSRAGLS
jgi:predicted GIY-YIG superfamily endonuclease